MEGKHPGRGRGAIQVFEHWAGVSGPGRAEGLPPRGLQSVSAGNRPWGDTALPAGAFRPPVSFVLGTRQSHPSAAALECGAVCACAGPCSVLLPQAWAVLCPVAGHGSGPGPARGARPEGTRHTRVQRARHCAGSPEHGLSLTARSLEGCLEEMGFRLRPGEAGASSYGEVGSGPCRRRQDGG